LLVNLGLVVVIEPWVIESASHAVCLILNEVSREGLLPLEVLANMDMHSRDVVVEKFNISCLCLFVHF
jgi:hypothetical protein